MTWYPFRLIGKGLGYLLKDKVMISTTGADFAGRLDYGEYLNPWNKGLILDGDDLRLSLKESMQNVCVIARIGAGKTSRYIVPNVLDKARRNCSIVVNDPKGEVFDLTSGHMAQQGFKVLVIDPENLSRSCRFNPLAEARDTIELEQIAEILVRAGSTDTAKDDFWVQGAMRFVSLFIKCLHNAAFDNSNYLNLYNLNYLFQNFGKNGEALKEFMDAYTVDPNNPKDLTLWNEWRGLMTGNEQGIRSFVLNAITALKSLTNPNVAKLTSTSDIDLEQLKSEKTIIYFITPPQYSEYYRFLTSSFFRCVFNACMRKLPDRKDLPVYVLYDEFGHSTIPNFVSTANTIRGYSVSISVVLQSIRQLDAQYGSDYAESILGGFNTYVTYSGADHSTAEFFEKIIGPVRERHKKALDDPTGEYREYSLIHAAEVRTIDKDEALIVSSNKQPIRLRSTPFFEHRRFRRLTRKKAYIETKVHPTGRLDTVPLQNIPIRDDD